MMVGQLTVDLDLKLTENAERILARIETDSKSCISLGLADPALPEALALVEHVATMSDDSIDRLQDEGFTLLAEKARAFKIAVHK